MWWDPNPWSDDSDDEPGFFFPNIFGSDYEYEAERVPIFGPKDVFFLALFIVVLLALLVLFYLLYRFLPPLLIELCRLTASLGKLIISVLALSLAGLLFWLRETRRMFYGAIEVCFGVVSIWVALDVATLDYAKWVAVITAVYLVVRGLDNLVSGYRIRRELRLTSIRP